jgi:transposase InsO family protein
MEKDVELEQELRDIYYNPKTGYQSAERLYQKALAEGLGVTRKQVKLWLKTQDTYTRYKPIVRRHKFRQTSVGYLGEQIQMDLVDMSKYRNKNKGYNWILTAVELLSRYAFTVPVLRKDTNNMTTAVTELLGQFKGRFAVYPKLAQFDDGKEFYNVGVKSLLEKLGVRYFSTYSEKKAAVVERFNRTLKTSMWKYFYSKGTYNWVDVLQSLTNSYNNTKHSAILMKPNNVSEDNQGEVWMTLFGHNYGDLPLPKFKVGDTVRVSRYKSTFTKGYEANFTEELFKVTKVLRGHPNVYEVEDLEGEPVIGKFYEEELSGVDKKDDVYRVEKVLKSKKVRGKKMVLIKWLGYDSKHNSWIPESDLQNIR